MVATASLYMLASTISGNSVTGAGGVAGGVGMRTSTSTQVEILGTSFYNNEAVSGDGGGLYLDTEDISFVEIKYNQFDQNTAGGRGGGALLDLGYAQVLWRQRVSRQRQQPVRAADCICLEDDELPTSRDYISVQLPSSAIAPAPTAAVPQSMFWGRRYAFRAGQICRVHRMTTQFNDNSADVQGGGGCISTLTIR